MGFIGFHDLGWAVVAMAHRDNLSNIGVLLQKRAWANGNSEAYVGVESGHRMSFAHLNQRANQFANALRADGIQPGQRVALLLLNGSAFFQAFFALAKIGAVIVPLNWRLTVDELAFLCDDSGACRLIYDVEFLTTVKALEQCPESAAIDQWLQVGESLSTADFAADYERFCERGAIDEPAVTSGDDDYLFIMYSSGTTGLPKGIIHSHRTVMAAIQTIVATSQPKVRQRYINMLPMFHVGALTPLLVNVYSGVTSVMMRAFDPQRAWHAIDRERIDSGLMVPAMLQAMSMVAVADRGDHSSLQWLSVGAAPVPPSLIIEYSKLGIQLRQVYGLTETCGPACVMDDSNGLLRPHSAGRSFFLTDVRIVDAEGRDCACDEAGEVLIRGDHLMVGYWRRPEATAEALRDGWLFSGDIGSRDDEGFVTILDRKKDMIISGGENIYPAEIEAVLLAQDGITDAAVIGQPSDRWGESPVAMLVAQGLSEKQVIDGCRQRLAAYKLPVAVTFVDHIPRNPSGKILKRVLRERYTPADVES